jgi:bifunctional DNA-binding transcriptional regulator/antitoxin component of YhaV-PrlF toxin-antitoxin module
MWVRMSSKGQIVLPAALRKKYDASPGAEWALIDMGDYVALVPRSKDPINEIRGMFKGREGVSEVDEFLRERREDQARSDEKFRRRFVDK